MEGWHLFDEPYRTYGAPLFLAMFPALAGWANLCRASGAWFRDLLAGSFQTNQVNNPRARAGKLTWGEGDSNFGGTAAVIAREKWLAAVRLRNCLGA
jgi:hypothetical protein